MRLSRGLFALILIGSVSLLTSAQNSARVVKVKPGESVYKVKPGSAVQVSVVIDVDDGYHINSNRPGQAFLIPTALKFDRMAGLTTTAVLYPKPKHQKFSFSEKPMSVYEGKAVLRFTARASRTLATGSRSLKGKLTVQACNDQLCLRPQTINVDIPIEVVN